MHDMERERERREEGREREEGRAGGAGDELKSEMCF